MIVFWKAAKKEAAMQIGLRLHDSAELPLAAWLFPTVGLLFGADMTLKGFSDAYLARAYDEIKKRPVYVVKDGFNLGDD